MGIRWKSLFRYDISDTGDVLNTITNRLISTQTNKEGYKKVSLTDDVGIRKTYSVHRLVAELYIPNPENKETVNHIDADKANNLCSNLEWSTRSENIQHAWDSGCIQDMEKRKAGIRDKQGKPVICVTTGEIFNSIGLAADTLGLQKSNISAVCLNKIGFKSAGKTEDGRPRNWEFYYGKL